jgi:hypothetical protein
VVNFFFTEYWLPGIWLLIVAGAWLLRRNRLFPMHLLALYFGIWFVFQTKLNSRFAIYIYPALVVVAVAAVESLRRKSARLAGLSIVGGQVLIGVIVLCIYSGDFFRYQLNRDKYQFLKNTFYYSEYQWINQHLPQDARLLVIVSDARTYYLDRWYIRADPWDSAAVPWPEVATAKDLKKLLEKWRINYVLYSLTDGWSLAEVGGGPTVIKIMDELRKDDSSTVVWMRDVPLCVSRVHREYIMTKTWLMHIRE